MQGWKASLAINSGFVNHVHCPDFQGWERIDNLCAAQLCMMSGHEAFQMRMPFHCSIYITVRTKDKNKSSQGKVEIPWLTTPLAFLINSNFWPMTCTNRHKVLHLQDVFTQNIQTLRILHLKLNLALHFKRHQSLPINHTYWVQTEVQICFSLFSTFLSPKVYILNRSIRQCQYLTLKYSQ